MLYFVTLSVGAVSLFFFLLERSKKHSVKALVLKAATSLFFILTACCGLFYKADISSGFALKAAALDFSAASFGVLIIAGLVCGMLGDIWLDLKFIYPQHDKIYTYSGFCSFGIGHLFFIASVIGRLEDPFAPLLKAGIIAFVFALAVALTEKPMGLKYGKYKTISLIYGFVLSFMTAFAAMACISEKLSIKSAPGILFIGGVFFIISDLILTNTYFSQGRDTPPYVVSNHVAYYLAQFIIASSVLFI